MGTEGGMRGGTWRDPRGVEEGTVFLLISTVGNEVGMCCVSSARVLDPAGEKEPRWDVRGKVSTALIKLAVTLRACACMLRSAS